MMGGLQYAAEACGPLSPLANVPFFIGAAHLQNCAALGFCWFPPSPFFQAFGHLCKTLTACAHLPPPAFFLFSR